MKQESIIVLLQQVDLDVSVLPRLHVNKGALGRSHLRDEGLTGLAHHEHGKVVAVLLVLVDYVLGDGREGLLVPFVGDGFLTVAWDVDAVYLAQ